MKTDISDPFKSVAKTAYEGTEFNLVVSCRSEDLIELNGDVNYYIIAHLVLPCGQPPLRFVTAAMHEVMAVLPTSI
jgi:hypothetical protein